MPSVFDNAQATIVARLRSGETAARIAADYGASGSALGHRLRAWGEIPDGGDRRRVSYSRDRVVEKYLAGEPISQIARAIGISYYTLRQNLKRWRVWKEPRKLDVVEIASRYEVGESLDDLAEAYDSCRPTITKLLRQHGMQIRPTGKRTYFFNQRFFESIDSEEKAYWLGFLFADGTVASSLQSVRLELACRDRDHVEKFQTAVNTQSPIIPTHDGKASLLVLSSIRTVGDLVRLGCTPRKSATATTPNLPPELYRHFYRGYTDGDGSIYYSRNTWGYKIIGSPGFIADFKVWLALHAGVTLTKSEHLGPVDSWAKRGRWQVERICHLLYDEASIFMDRKYRRFQLLSRGTGKPSNVL